jgi:hypothetical protein
LNNVEYNLDRMNADARRAESELTEMEKCCGLCVCPWNKRMPFEASLKYQAAYGYGGTSTEDDKKSTPAAPVTAQPAAGGGSGGYVKRITNDAREDEMDANIGAVSSILGELKMQVRR